MTKLNAELLMLMTQTYCDNRVSDREMDLKLVELQAEKLESFIRSKIEDATTLWQRINRLEYGKNKELLKEDK